MDRNGLFLLSLIALAAAALAVGGAGWLLWARDHRVWKASHPHAAHPKVTEAS